MAWPRDSPFLQREASLTNFEPTATTETKPPQQQP